MQPADHSEEALIMKDPFYGNSDDQKIPETRPTRREFLKLSALGVVGAAASRVVAPGLAKGEPGRASMGKDNSMPGRIVRLHDPGMLGHEATINRDLVEEHVHLAVRTLTGIDDTALAFESLFRDLKATSSFALKVNCIGPTCTRWEVVRGVVSGLSQMLGGTYDVSQVTVYDPHYLPSYGYDAAEFTFNGHTAVLSNSNNASNSGYQPWPGYHLSRYILNSDFVINVPALKSHTTSNQITVAMKNHYGSCSPQSLCGNLPGMLALNACAEVKDKTALTVTDCLRGTYNGGPGESPQSWNTFAEATPNTILATTDPVTNEYWSRDIINAERTARGWSIKPCSWIETASGDPYFLGVSDPAAMTVINLDPYLGVEEDRPGVAIGTTFLAANVPNPFSSSTTLHFRMGEAGPAALKVYDASGRLVRSLEQRHYSAGYHQTTWDGRDSNGAGVAPGVYFARFEAGHKVSVRRVVRVQ
jgi:hypothetical protein